MKVLLLTLLLGQYAPQRAGSEPLDPDREARVQRLGKELRCAVCQGLSIADSPASMARAQLDKVRALVAEGKTDQEIRDYFIARYGAWVLLEPERKGISLAVWLLPVAVLLIGGWFIFRQLKGPPPPSPPPPAATEGDPGEDPYLRQVREELNR